MAYQDTVAKGTTLTPANFTNPPLEMGIVPFWFWNGKMEPEEMEWQLRQYHEKGVRSLFLHGRMGLKVPYLSEGWFERVQFAVEKAKEIGLDMWVYDEMDWPSGTAERQVLEAYPHLAQRYLELVPLYIKGPLFTFLEAQDSRYMNTGPAEAVAAYGVRQEQYRSTISEVLDLNKNLSFVNTIPWEAPEGDWVLLYFVEKEAPWYIDTLNPESTERFLELTHDRYKEAVGEAFGGAVPGFFTDEPAMYYYQVGMQNHVLPWSKKMFKIFRERRGYDLKPHLPALYANMGAQTAQVRYDFWRTLTEQYEETYYKRIRTWCEDNGVLFTGHLLFEEWLRGHARCEGNLFKYLRHMDIIGVDHLYPRIGTEDRPDQHVALKIGSSAAHHFGSARLLCESMGGTYWDCTLERMKWMANWEYVLGVNLFNNHGYHYSIEGERKRDWPPSQFYHHTWWKDYDHFIQYIARLSHVLSGGRHVAKVLMLYPIASLWANYVPQRRDPVSEVIEADFNYLTDTLLRLHYDFDYVDEDVLAEATVEDGTIQIRDERFEVFILPPVTHIKQTTFDKLRQFVESGGSLIADTLLPVGLLETKDGSMGAVNGFFGTDPEALLKAFESDKAGAFEVTHRNGNGTAPPPRTGGDTGKGNPEVHGNVFVLQGEGLHRSRPKEQLRDILHRCATPDVTVSDEQVFYLHRVKDDFDLYFFVNTTQEDRGSVAITFEQVARPALWDPNTGAISPIHTYRIEDGRLALDLTFPASGSQLVVLQGTLDGPHVTETNLDISDIENGHVVGYAANLEDEVFVVVAENQTTRRLTASTKAPLPPLVLPEDYAFETQEDNVLLVADWKMAMEDDNGVDQAWSRPDFDDSDWLDVTNGAWEMQLPQERDEETYPVAVWYRTAFEIRDVPPDTRLLIDGFSGSAYRLFVNGEEIADKGRRSRLDAEIMEVNIQPHIQQGRNVVAVRLEVQRRTDGILDLLKIIGTFSVASSEDDGYAMVAPKNQLTVGDWTQQGYPFFSGTGVYRAEIDVPDAYLEGRLFLEAEIGDDVLAVRFNGGEARVAPWHPYRLDVTDLVQPGRNTVEIQVTNTLINLLEGVQRASGLFAAPRLVHEHRYTLDLQQ